MSGLVGFVFSVGGAVTCFACAALWLLARPASAAARRCVIAIGLSYLACATYGVPAAAAALLTRAYRPFEARDAGADPIALVVLGAGGDSVTGWEKDRQMPLLNLDGGSRVLEAWRVFRHLHPAWVISSGGNDPAEGAKPNGVVMRDVLVGLGVPPERIRIEIQSRDTHDEAMVVAGMLRGLHVERLVVVTSDIHMRRALGAFRAQGLDPVPAIAPDPRPALPGFVRWRPSQHGLDLSGGVAHELVGILYYRARGWWR